MEYGGGVGDIIVPTEIPIEFPDVTSVLQTPNPPDHHPHLQSFEMVDRYFH